MKHYILIILAVVALSSCNKERPTSMAPQKALTVYDSALLTLRDFVANGDLRLGFASAGEFDSAYIDLTAPIQEFYLRYDTMQNNGGQAIDSILINMGRFMYPVYRHSNGGRILCSAITFDTAGGTRPVLFEDSTILEPVTRDMKNSSPTDSAQYGIIEMPFIMNRATIRHSKKGVHIIATKSLRATLGDDFPKTEGDSSDAIESDSFFKSVLAHVKKKK